MKSLQANLMDFLSHYVQSETAETLRSIILFLIFIIIAIIANFFTKKIILQVVKKIILRTRTTYDDVFLQQRVFSRLSHVVPALILYYTIAFVFRKNYDYPFDHLAIVSFIHAACNIYMVVTVLLFLDAFLNSWLEIYERLSVKHNFRISIKGYVQVVKIVLIIMGVILIISVMLGKRPGTIFAGLGAMAAVLMLIFKDTLLGFVASIQLSAYKMLKPGDWISMPSRKADGDVLDISLTTVKVQNFDKTITTIPTYALVSESFTNWSGMQEAGARRIKRSIHIDMNTIQFCTPEMLERFAKIEHLKDYLENKHSAIISYNESKSSDLSIETNGRRLTNIGTFRAYVQRYLEANLDEVERTIEVVGDEIKENKKTLKPGKFASGMTLLVRQLAPETTGLPIEVYVFTTTTNWVEYESIQSDLFDHILAVVPVFGLRIFQSPTGYDLHGLTKPANESIKSS